MWVNDRLTNIKIRFLTILYNIGNQQWSISCSWAMLVMDMTYRSLPCCISGPIIWKRSKLAIWFSGEKQHCYKVCLYIFGCSCSWYESVAEWRTYLMSGSLLRLVTPVRFPCYSSALCGHECQALKSYCKSNKTKLKLRLARFR